MSCSRLPQLGARNPRLPNDVPSWMPVLSAILIVLGLIAGTIGVVAPSVTGIGLCLLLLILAGALMDGRLAGSRSRGAHRLD
jgi:hypothetical protein